MARTDQAIDDAMAELIGQLVCDELTDDEFNAIKEKIDFLKSLERHE